MRVWPSQKQYPATAGVINALSATLAHIPCCGSQIVMSAFGIQALGALSSTVLYKFQLAIPAIVTLTACLTVWLWRKRAQRHWSLTDLKLFVATNLLIGYAVTLILYLTLPPHAHQTLDVVTYATVSPDGETALIHYQDNTRHWPWSDRRFITNISLETQPAEEIIWYKPTPPEGPLTIPAHLTQRPSALWFQKATAGTAPSPKIQLSAPEFDQIFPQAQPSPRLILFYSQDCGPCHIEMKNIEKLKMAASGFQVSILALSPLPDALKQTLDQNGIETKVLSGAIGKLILESNQPPPSRLPYSLAMDASHQICGFRLGILGPESIRKWRTSCLK